MNKMVRFSVSAFFGAAVTCVLFLTMQSLLGSQKNYRSNETPNINFGFVKNYKQPIVSEPKKTTLPEPKEISNPPAAPALSLSDYGTDNDLYLPDGIQTKAEWKVLNNIPMTHVGMGDGAPAGQGGTLKVGIAPMYPPALLQRKRLRAG